MPPPDELLARPSPGQTDAHLDEQFLEPPGRVRDQRGLGGDRRDPAMCPAAELLDDLGQVIERTRHDPEVIDDGPQRPQSRIVAVEQRRP